MRDRTQRIYQIIERTIPPAVLHPSALTRATLLEQGLGADSLDRIALQITLEREFGVSIPESDVDAWKTIGDVIETVDRIVTSP